MILVREAESRADLKTFIHLPWRLYRSDPNWVPPMLTEMWETMTSPKNAQFKAGPHKAFVAYKDGEPMGRILCGIAHDLNQTKKQKAGWISLFESANDLQVAQALFTAVEDWMRTMGMKEIKGPFSPTRGDDYRGVLVQGFDSPPVLMDSYNPAYYPEFFDACGYTKDMDVFAFRMDKDHVPPRLDRVSEYAMKRYHFRVEPIRMDEHLPEDLRDIKEILDKAMPEDWPDWTVPSMEDVDEEARRLKPLADPEIILIARSEAGKAIGFIVGLPNYNEVLAHMNGRLFPFGWLQFLVRRKRIKSVRIFVLMVIPEWRKKAVTGAMFAYCVHTAFKRGYEWGEGSTIPETNTPMLRDAEGAGGQHYKTYRLYTKQL